MHHRRIDMVRSVVMISTKIHHHNLEKQWSTSWKSPIMELHPGPPLNQVARGAVLALFRASKNLSITVNGDGHRHYTQCLIPKPHVHVRSHGQIPGVLIDARSGFADT